MSHISITDLFIYPIKSTYRIPLIYSDVRSDGLMHDRSFAVINSAGKILTARENQALLKIKTSIEQDLLTCAAEGHSSLTLTISGDHESVSEEVMIFKDPMQAKVLHHPINAWISEVIGESAQLVQIDDVQQREMKAKYNGRAQDYIGFQDASAIHLISEDSLDALNEELERPVNMHHFRPNIVVTDTIAYEEDQWKRVIIGNCEFEVAIKTARCPMITIDPETRAKDTQQQPLKTLAQLRKENNKVNFGIYLIPRTLGSIHIGDEVIVER